MIPKLKSLRDKLNEVEALKKELVKVEDEVEEVVGVKGSKIKRTSLKKAK